MKRSALWILALYKRWISPSLAPSCRYVPTCSEYASEAIERYGIFRGGAMAAWRLLRCHPLVKGGYDPVVKNSTQYPLYDCDERLIITQDTKVYEGCSTNQELAACVRHQHRADLSRTC